MAVVDEAGGVTVVAVFAEDAMGEVMLVVVPSAEMGEEEEGDDETSI